VQHVSNSFPSTRIRGFLPDGNSSGNDMENGGKQNPESGFKSPPEQRKKFGRPQKTTLLIDFYAILTSIMVAKFGIHPDALGRIRRSARKALSVDIYPRRDGRYHIIWQDETGNRRYTTRLSLSPRCQTPPIRETRRTRAAPGRKV